MPNHPIDVPSTRERLAELKFRIHEYEQVIASFESMNGNLRMRRVNASAEIKNFCDRHIEQNSRTIVAMKRNLGHMQKQIADESA